MGVKGRINAVERKLGADTRDRSEESDKRVGYLTVLADGTLVDPDGNQLTREEAEARYQVIYTMPDNGRNPGMIRGG